MARKLKFKPAPRPSEKEVVTAACPKCGYCGAKEPGIVTARDIIQLPGMPDIDWARATFYCAHCGAVFSCQLMMLPKQENPGHLILPKNMVN